MASPTVDTSQADSRVKPRWRKAPLPHGAARMTDIPHEPGSAARAIVRAIAARIPDLDIRSDDLALYESDIFYVAEHPPVAVVAPERAEQIVALTRLAREAGFHLATRGAGLSYSAGYLPGDARTVVVDMRGMNRILDIDVVDRHVTVESGVTWAALHAALAPLKLTTPFWGTFSGRHATIGASVSQGAKFFGSASRGGSAESVLALKLVTGAGETLITGSAAGAEAPSPFFRNYGPDLTGIFLGDCGAFGVKLEITLQLIPAPEAITFGSWSFDDPLAELGAMARIGAELLASECLGTDPFTARSRMKSEGLASDFGALAQVVRGSSSILAGLRDAAQIAWSGRRFAEGVGYLMNVTAEGRDHAEARAKMARIARIAAGAGGRALPASIPKVLRADPFPPMNGLLTPSGKRMNWLHVVVPNSRGGECFRSTEEVFARNAEAMRRHGVDRGYLLSTHGPTAVGVETLLRWSDAPYPIHTHYLDEAQRARLRPRADNPEARAFVVALSREIVAAWRGAGGAHLQIGRKYPYLETRLPETATLLRHLKQRLDPDGVMNPGNLFD